MLWRKLGLLGRVSEKEFLTRVLSLITEVCTTLKELYYRLLACLPIR